MLPCLFFSTVLSLSPNLNLDVFYVSNDVSKTRSHFVQMFLMLYLLQMWHTCINYSWWSRWPSYNSQKEVLCCYAVGIRKWADTNIRKKLRLRCQQTLSPIPHLCKERSLSIHDSWNIIASLLKRVCTFSIVHQILTQRGSRRALE